MEVCCRLRDQGEEVGEAFFKQFQDVSLSLTLADSHEKIFPL